MKDLALMFSEPAGRTDTSAPDPLISYESCTCHEGKCFNNADPTSGQFHECTECDWENYL